jgi:hypothetical protein
METRTNTVRLFLDAAAEPIGEFAAPVTFDLDSRRLADGPHVLKIMSRDTLGAEGAREIRFTVRNGPAIDVEGLRENETVDGVLPLLINAYGKGDQKRFIPLGSETPRGLPAWVVVLIIFFCGWAAHYLITYAVVKP